MIRALLYDRNDRSLHTGGQELIAAWRERRGAEADRLFLWVDVGDEPEVVERPLLQLGFGLHPLAVQDALRDRHPPKVELFEGCLFVLLKGLSPGSADTDFETIQIGLFAGRDFMVSRHSEVSNSVNRTWQDCTSTPELLDAGSFALALRVTRYVVDRYVSVLLNLESRLDEIEAETLERPGDRLLAELARYKAELTRLRRVLAYHAQVFNLGRQNVLVDLHGRRLTHEVNDVIEQLDRANNLATLYYDLCNDLMSSYISLASHRLNGIMKVLTIITAIFVPLSFIAGIYGMNFENMPELHSRYGYFAVLGTMVLVVALLLVLFRRRGWL